MSKAKWTPGPWKLELFGTASENIFAANGKHIVNISTTRCGGNKTTVYSPEAEANACLIAQAPEMAEILQRIVDAPNDIVMTILLDEARAILEAAGDAL